MASRSFCIALSWRASRPAAADGADAIVWECVRSNEGEVELRLALEWMAQYMCLRNPALCLSGSDRGYFVYSADSRDGWWIGAGIVVGSGGSFKLRVVDARSKPMYMEHVGVS